MENGLYRFTPFGTFPAKVYLNRTQIVLQNTDMEKLDIFIIVVLWSRWQLLPVNGLNWQTQIWPAIEILIYVCWS